MLANLRFSNSGLHWFETYLIAILPFSPKLKRVVFRNINLFSVIMLGRDSK